MSFDIPTLKAEIKDEAKALFQAKVSETVESGKTSAATSINDLYPDPEQRPPEVTELLNTINSTQPPEHIPMIGDLIDCILDPLLDKILP